MMGVCWVRAQHDRWRVRAGLARARSEGKQLGRRPSSRRWKPRWKPPKPSPTVLACARSRSSSGSALDGAEDAPPFRGRRRHVRRGRDW